MNAQTYLPIPHYAGLAVCQAEHPFQPDAFQDGVVVQAEDKLDLPLAQLLQQGVVIAEIAVAHHHGPRLDTLAENLPLAGAVGRNRPSLGHLIEHRKLQVQAPGPA